MRPALIKLNGSRIKWSDILLLLNNKPIKIKPLYSRRFNNAFNALKNAISRGKKIYGVNTGFGKLSDVIVDKDYIIDLQMNLLRSTACGVGGILPRHLSKSMFILRINSLLNGYSGVSKQLVDHMCDMFNNDMIPVIPLKGSVGASGDLAPLAHMALTIVGEDNIFDGSRIRSAALAHRKKRLKPHTLRPKEGLALINGMQFTLARLLESIFNTESILRSCEKITALTIDSLLCSKRPFNRVVTDSRQNKGARIVSDNILYMLKGSEILESHKECLKIQDQYSIRCIPQIHGTVQNVLDRCKEIALQEANSTTDNPLISANGEVISAGNFHGQPLAQACDELRIALSALSNIIERRIDAILNPALTDLPPFLAHNPGIESGFMVVQILGSALAAENRVLSTPASNQTIPTGANKEDVVSMAPISADLLGKIIINLWYLLACELICAAEALEYRRPLKSSPRCEEVYRFARKYVKRLKGDRSLSAEIETLTGQLSSYKLSGL